MLAGESVLCSRTEFDLLLTLARHPGVVFTRDRLLERVWGPEFIGTERVVDVSIQTLRRKLGDDPEAPKFIVTVRGVGYRFRGERTMRLLPRLFRSHALVVLLTVLALLVLAELFAPTYIQHHVDQMVELIGRAGRFLRGDLSRGMRNTFTGALLLSAAFALLVAFIMAFLASQRVVRAIRQLSAGSQAITAGEYQRRLPDGGTDELAELARNFDRMAEVLAQVEESRVAMITNVAHELRTPLTALQGYAEALNDRVMPAEHAGMYSIGSMAISSSGTANTALNWTERQSSATSRSLGRARSRSGGRSPGILTSEPPIGARGVRKSMAWRGTVMGFWLK